MAKRPNKKQKIIAPAPVHEGVLSTEFVLPEWKLALIHAVIISAAGLWIYSPAFYGGWIWDDDMYFNGNPLLNDPARLWKAWFQPGSFVEYYPISQTVQWIQWQLWRNDTLGYHLTNVCLHLLSALLVWRLLSKFGLRQAWLGGLIFAIHPMMVESVAWISELKNTLSLPPFLLAMCAWIDYEERGRSRDYFLALGLFLVAMLCKITVMMFPVVILFYAWWKRGRIGWTDLKVSAPFFILSLAIGLITILSGVWGRIFNHLGPEDALVGGAGARLVLVGLEIAFYFSKSFLPVGLLPVYPMWTVDVSSPVQYLPWVVLIGVIGWLWTKRQSWGRHALLGLGFFFINLTPCPGFIPAPNMEYAWTMDHFLYLPIIGLIGIVVAGIERIEARLAASARPVGTGIFTLILGSLAFESHWYAAAFTGEETFWNYTIDRNPQAWIAHNNLGKVLLVDKQPELAKEHFDTVIRLKPELAEPYCNLGTALVQLGQIPEAVEAFNQSLKRDPHSPEAHNDLGILLAQKGQTAEALGHFEQALRGRPLYAEAHNNMGNTLLLAGRTSEAIKQFQAAVQNDPSYAAARDNLGMALAQSGRVTEAIEQYQQALQINPDDDKARQGLAKLQQTEMQQPTPNGH